MKNRTEHESEQLAKMVLLLVDGVMIDDDGKKQAVPNATAAELKITANLGYQDEEDAGQDKEEETLPREEQGRDSEEEENFPKTQQSKRSKLIDGDLTQDYNPVQEAENPPPGSVQVSPNYRKGATANELDIEEQPKAVSKASAQTTNTSMTKRGNASLLELKGDGDFVRRSVRNTVKDVTKQEVATLYADPEIQTLLAGNNEGHNLQTIQPDDSEMETLVVPVR